MWSVLACMQKLLIESMHERCWVCMAVWYIYGLYGICWSLCCEILLLLNMVDMD